MNSMTKLKSNKSSQDNSLHGISLDVLSMLAAELNFSVTFSSPADNEFGSMDPITGEWTGVVGMLVEEDQPRAERWFSMKYAVHFHTLPTGNFSRRMIACRNF